MLLSVSVPATLALAHRAPVTPTSRILLNPQGLSPCGALELPGTLALWLFPSLASPGPSESLPGHPISVAPYTTCFPSWCLDHPATVQSMRSLCVHPNRRAAIVLK